MLRLFVIRCTDHLAKKICDIWNSCLKLHVKKQGQNSYFFCTRMQFENQEEIDKYLDELLEKEKPTLQQLFDDKIRESGISKTLAFKIMGVRTVTMEGILQGSQKQVDVLNLVKLANFLQKPLEEVISLFVRNIEKRFPVEGINVDEVQFIKENFNLAVLKSAGFIDSISDFSEIKKRLLARLGLKSIFEYKRPEIDIAFSSGLTFPDMDKTRSFWVNSARSILREIDNPFQFDREQLIKVFPRLCWYSKNVENGLMEISKLLFKLGVTVIFHPPLQSLKIKGATLNHNGKPAIILSNYRGYYATLWFTLFHELYHVLFDWDDIKGGNFHISDDSLTELAYLERERDADQFSRKYLLSEERLDYIKPRIRDHEFVKQFADDQMIHYSIVYAFYAFENKSSNRSAWALARKYSPSLNSCKLPVNWNWNDQSSIEDIAPNFLKQFF